ncbi:TPA: hypothetical protein ACSPZX_000760 [Aeromonas veronii]
MKKSLIALAVAGLSFNAAALDLSSTTAQEAGKDYPLLASELKMPQIVKSGVGVKNALEVKFKQATAAADATQYVRVQVTNAVFSNLVAANLSSVANGEAPIVATAVDAGNGLNYAVFSVKPIPATKDAGEVAYTVTIPEAILSGGDVGVSVAVFNDKTAALNNLGGTDAKSGTLVAYKPALQVAVKDKAAQLSAESFATQFVSGGKAGTLAQFTLGVAPVKVDDLGVAAPGYDFAGPDGTGVLKALTIDNLRDETKSKLVVNGDFSAGVKSSDKLVDGTTKLGSASADAGKVTASATQFSGDKVKSGDFVYTVDGKTEVAEQTLTGKLTLAAPASSKYEIAEEFSFSPFGTIARASQSKSVYMTVAPDSSYTQLIRVTNDTAQDGTFRLTVINDDGAKVSFPISKVAGVASDTVKKYASSVQMKIADIYAAANAEGLEVSGQGKLRLEVSGTVNKMDIQSFILSKDGNVITKF